MRYVDVIIRVGVPNGFPVDKTRLEKCVKQLLLVGQNDACDSVADPELDHSEDNAVICSRLRIGKVTG